MIGEIEERKEQQENNICAFRVIAIHYGSQSMSINMTSWYAILLMMYYYMIHWQNITQIREEFIKWQYGNVKRRETVTPTCEVDALDNLHAFHCSPHTAVC